MDPWNPILPISWLSWRPDIFQHAFASERAVVTPYTFATVFLPALGSFYLMAVLVQLPSTRLYRAALLPVIFWMALRVNMSLDFSWNSPGYAFLNQGLAVYTFTAVMRSTAWVFSQHLYTRLPIYKLANGAISGNEANAPIESNVSVPTAMWNAWDLIINFRGVGWNGPPRVYIPKPYFRVESRLTFFLLSLCRLILLVFAFDATGAFVRFLGPNTFGSPSGGSIFDPSLPPLQRYTQSSILTLVTGFGGYFVMNAIFQLHAALFTLLFQQYPSQWPPVFDCPMFSTSLTSFWGQKWHQVFREPFVAIAGDPMEKYFGRVGRVLGAFALSSVLHDIGMRGMGRGPHALPMMAFFLLQGVGVIMEYKWKQATGSRVGGVSGLLWVYTVLVLSGHIIVDAWAKGGLLGSEFVPKAYRPTALLLSWLSGENVL